MPTGYESGKTWSPIGEQVAASVDAASRVWTVNEVANYETAGSWPVPLGPSWEAITTVTNTGTTNAITFTSIPQTYTNLKIVFTGEVDSDNHYNEFKLNTETSAAKYNSAYWMGYVNAAGPSPTFAIQGAIGSEWFPAFQFPRASSADIMQCIIIELPNYSGTTLFKPAFAYGTSRHEITYSGAQSEGGPFAAWYMYEDTSGITQIEMDSYGSKNWKNFTVTLYGMAS
jgi:hypothetical protein